MPPALSLDAVAAVAGPDPVGGAFAAARAARGVAGASPVEATLVPERPLSLADAVLALYAAEGIEPTREERAALVASAAALPPEWAASGALVLFAMVDALRLAESGPDGALLGAERVARAVESSTRILGAAGTIDGVGFEDPYRTVRIDASVRNDTHVVPYRLLVDGGGDDAYVGAHGGATENRPVSVVLDLAGNDAYSTVSPIAEASQGASALGVLGLLYDAHGNDTYVATTEISSGPVAFQGGCWGAGVGILVDAEGDDAYDAHIPDQGGAQGGARTCTGILLDLGGDDRFVASAPSGDAAQGGGYLGGVGILASRGGDDAYDATTLTHHGSAHSGLGLLVDYGGRDAYNGDESYNNETRVGIGRTVFEMGGLLVDQERVQLVTSGAVRVPLLAAVTDDDGDGSYALRFRLYDIRVSADGSMTQTDVGPFQPAGRPYLGDPDDQEGLERVDLSGPPRCVVALVDSGINPYHRDFRGVAWPADPADWVPGYPSGVTPLALDLASVSYSEAVESDAALWAGVEEDVIYTFPGTRIIAAVSMGRVGNDPIGDTRILDDRGHGTHVAGAAAGTHTGLGPQCAVVIVEAEDRARGIRWAANQTWIDVVSVSIGTFGGAYQPNEVANATRVAARSGKLVVVASGNGATGFDVPDPVASVWSPYAGPGWVLTVGASAPWNDMPVWWGAYPVDVLSRGVNVRTPSHQSVVDYAQFGGSSAATPRVAGAAAAVLFAARAVAADGLPESGPLADGALERGELSRSVLRTARVANATGFVTACLATGVERCAVAERWWLYLVPAVDGVEFVTAGYGIVDASTRDAAIAVVRGEEPMPTRLEEDAWWELVHAVRESFWAAHDDGRLYFRL